MKTQFYQIAIIVGIFTLSISATLAVSWGMTGLFFQEKHATTLSSKRIILQHTNAQLDVDFSQSFRLLIPKLNR
ncbi:MAG TPA: hypothetical protein ENJ41_06925 [Oceanospirillales bacterium]|nr:hypothetical protein [Oceanospirillales bacterium]